MGQFNGHTHKEQFNVYVHENRARSVAFNAGSVTPYAKSNPNYRVYAVDSFTWVSTNLVYNNALHFFELIFCDLLRQETSLKKTIKSIFLFLLKVSKAKEKYYFQIVCFPHSKNNEKIDSCLWILFL